MLIPVHHGTPGSAEAAADELLDPLICRNDDLESEKRAVLAENDALTAENTDLRKSWPSRPGSWQP